MVVMNARNDISYRCPWRMQCPRPGKNGGCAGSQIADGLGSLPT